MTSLYRLTFIGSVLLFAACSKTQTDVAESIKPSDTTEYVVSSPQEVLKPVLSTDTVQFDTDDPAFWINKKDSSQSLIIGTDKDQNGAVYVFDLKGKIQKNKTVKGLKRPNNVDVEYGLIIGGKPVDIAVVTERFTHKLRVFSLPDMKAIDGGGLPVFEGETGESFRDLMGIALYKDSKSNIYAVVGRKSGPTQGSYLWQYKLEDAGNGSVKATLIRKFGKYSGKKEIESIAVDDELGYVYYSDEGVGVRKYYADPAKDSTELALFATTGFAEDHEGISIYDAGNGTGYILVSDQGANQFFIFSREGSPTDPNDHQLLKVVKTSTLESDGSDITNLPLNSDFKNGLFVAMSTNKTFQFYRWEDIAGNDLKVKTKLP
jgi:3-phytase